MSPKRLIGIVLASVLALVIAAACTSAPAPAPTAVPAKPAEAPKAAAPTTAPVAPTKAPEAPKPTEVPKIAFPEKGKSITVLVGSAAGGPNDVAARLIAAPMEKVLGVPVQVINKPGAGWQIALTELAGSKPDGYTIGLTPMPAAITTYLDSTRKAVYTRKSFQPLAMHVVDPGAVAVRPDGQYKSINDLLNAAKANPGKIKVAATGVLGDDHVAILKLQQQTGVDFAIVQFDGTPPAITALMGGHIDALFDNVGSFVAQFKSGQLGVLGIMDTVESKYYPGVKTFEQQGVKFVSYATRGIAMPAGAPKEVVDTLATAIKNSMQSPEHLSKMDELGFPVKYMSPAEYEAYWTEQEGVLKPFVDAETKTK